MEATLMLVLVTAVAACVPHRSTAQDSRSSSEPFKWSGDVQSGHWVYVRNMNGRVRVEQGTGSKVEVTGEKYWRRGRADDVEIKVTQVGTGKGDVLVCAIWRDTDTRCDEDGYSSRSNRDGWSHWGRDRDTEVEFTVRLPAGVKVEASSTNGSIEIDGATSEVIAHTTNGRIEARSSGGPVRASTTNGDVYVRTGALDTHDTEYRTTNGSITVELPATTNADLEMHTTNGSISSDFPVMMEGTFSRRDMRGTLGKGGPRIRLSTTNGSIRLRKA
jgi:DUF4097 and DUF4098 domain-containing protein YvlB